MITFRTEQYVPGLRARSAFHFLATFDDGVYQEWMPGEHLRVITYRRMPDHVGNSYFLDQLIGGIRVRATELIVEAVPDRRLLRQVTWFGLRAPIRMLFEFQDDDDGVLITHTLTAGFAGTGRVLDPLFRLGFCTPQFAAALDRHVRDELLALRELIPALAGRRALSATPLELQPQPLSTFAHF